MGRKGKNKYLYYASIYFSYKKRNFDPTKEVSELFCTTLPPNQKWISSPSCFKGESKGIYIHRPHSLVLFYYDINCSISYLQDRKGHSSLWTLFQDLSAESLELYKVLNRVLQPFPVTRKNTTDIYIVLKAHCWKCYGPITKLIILQKSK